ncbi:MAG: hypothetical protein WBL19_02525 [Minisyncoccia bacterium]
MNTFTLKKDVSLLLVISLALAILFSARLAFAENSPSDTEPVKVKTEYEVKYKSENRSSSEVSKVGFSINPSGAVQFGGAKFVSLSGANVAVTIYGLPLTLVTSSSTQLVGVSSLADMKAGDVLSGKGQINESAGTITALHIRDESQTSSRIADLERQIQVLLEQLKRLQAEVKNVR